MHTAHQSVSLLKSSGPKSVPLPQDLASSESLRTRSPRLQQCPPCALESVVDRVEASFREPSVLTPLVSAGSGDDEGGQAPSQERCRQRHPAGPLDSEPRSPPSDEQPRHRGDRFPRSWSPPASTSPNGGEVLRLPGRPRSPPESRHPSSVARSPWRTGVQRQACGANQPQPEDLNRFHTPTVPISLPESKPAPCGHP